MRPKQLLLIGAAILAAYSLTSFSGFEGNTGASAQQGQGGGQGGGGQNDKKKKDQQGGQGGGNNRQQGGQGGGNNRQQGGQGGGQNQQQGGQGRNNNQQQGGQGRNNNQQQGGQGRNNNQQQGGQGRNNNQQQGGQGRNNNQQGGQGRNNNQQQGGQGRNNNQQQGGQGGGQNQNQFNNRGPGQNPNRQGQQPQLQNPNRQGQQNQFQNQNRPRQQYQVFQPQYQQRGNRSYYNVGNTRYIQRNDYDRFRRFDPNARVMRYGNNFRTVTVSPNGTRVVTITDPYGRLIRRSRFVNGQEFIIIDNRFDGPRRPDQYFVTLPPPLIRMPQNQYIVDAGVAPPDYVYGALMAAPVAALDRQYTLDEIRFSPDVRNLMPRVDLDTITFASSSSDLAPDQFNRLAPIADGIKRAVSQNPSEVFLIEGHTDAVGETDENLALSDRRAETVADVLTNQFQIPPENLTTQGYGEQQLKVPTQGPERVNRRVTVRRITPLLEQRQANESDQDDQPQDQDQPQGQPQFAPQQQQQFAPQRP